MARALVLGAGGFIGTHLCAALRRTGDEVVAFGHGESPPWAQDDPGVAWVRGDFAYTALAVEAARGCDAVFHLIGSRSPALSDSDPVADLAGTVVATVRFLEALRAAPPRRFVFVSSGGTVYGPTDRLPIPEDAPTEPIGAYGINKLTIEKYVALHHRRHGLDACVLRVANPFGEHQVCQRQQGVVAAFIDAAVHGRPISVMGDGSSVRDYVYVGDVAEAMVRAARSPALAQRVLNVGSGRGCSLNEVAAAVERVSGRPLERIHAPARASDVPAVVLDIARAREALDWRPETPWEAALERTYRWALAQKGPA
ncbi:NAD-dependent epimerase/dehydratase family protein [Azospirillum sp. TSO22-1]|uniref:NAD-dependent epimerase/dehydratase family protein n=1 Tax=Azospirillum sp. TSO22-1 TaxID=716789 RepID=UPI000D612A4D|nr:NAD-dependent epimerase/dehydratase family protein [Azospirillum sp. TSO22-1]PWC55354.1 hypothetical protein TSO221_05365 [Azospirillum sp. TSO22-1]